MTTYKEAGVDIEGKNELLKKIKQHITSDARTISSGRLFKGLVVNAAELKKLKAPVIAFNTDGVGTKTLLAAQLDRWEGIGADTVNHCINDILTMGAKPICFSDYIATGRLDNAIVERIVKSIAQCCRENGITFTGGETAEMPDTYHEKAVDVVGFIMGATEKSGLVDGRNIREGDEIIGVASSGIHSNGFSLVRKLVKEGKIELSESTADALMEPHRNYLKTTLEVMKKHEVKGMAHVTGGSFRKNMPRILPNGLGAAISRKSWKPQEIFRLIQEKGGISEDEMYNTFNMGVGYVYVVGENEAEAVLKTLKKLNEKAYRIGKVTKGEGARFEQ